MRNADLTSVLAIKQPAPVRLSPRNHGGMISDVLAELRKDPSWERCLEANNERLEKVGQ